MQGFISKKSNNRMLTELSKVFFLTFISGCSLGLFGWQIVHWSRLESFLIQNNVSPLIQTEILIYITAMGVSLSVLLGVYALFTSKKYTMSATLYRANTMSTWFLFTFLLPALFKKSLWHTAPFFMMGLAVIFSLGIYWNLSRDNAVIERFFHRANVIASNRVCLVFLLSVFLFYCIYFSYYTILHHYQFGTSAFDLGIYQNALFNTLHGKFFATSFYEGDSIFTHHFSPIYLLWIPVYSILPYAETLLASQSITVAIGIFPLFFFARNLLRSNISALLIVVCYIFYPPQHGANFYDIHELAFLPVLIFCAFYTLEKKRTGWFFLFLILALAIKEDISCIVILLGIYLYVQKRRIPLSISVITAGMIWFFAARNVIITSGGMPYRHAFYYSSLLIQGQGGAGEIIRTLISNPVYTLKTICTSPKILYFLQMTTPFLFIPFFKKRNILLLVYGFLVALMASPEHSPLYSISFQYVWYLLPFLFITLVYTLKDIQLQSHVTGKPYKKAFHIKYYPLLVTMLFSAGMISWQYGAILNRTSFVGGFRTIDFDFSEQEKKRLTTLENFIALIPEDSSIGASETICPHLDQFQKVYTFRYLNSEPDYLLLFSPNYENPPKLQQFLHSAKYHIFKKEKGFQLLKHANYSEEIE